VRELRNILERAAILCDGGLITAEHLALNVPVERAASAPEALRRASPERAETSGERRREASAERQPVAVAATGDLSAMERAMIGQALQQARFNKSKAAKALGLTRAQLYVRMRKHGLE